MKLRNFNIMILLIVMSYLFSCSPIKNVVDNDNINEYKKFFEYIELSFKDKDCIYKNPSDQQIYLIGIYGKTDDRLIEDKYIIDFINSHNIAKVEIYNDLSETLKQKKITIEFESMPFIQKRSFLEKYLNSKINGNDNEKMISENIYFFQWKPTSY